MNVHLISNRFNRLLSVDHIWKHYFGKKYCWNIVTNQCKFSTLYIPFNDIPLDISLNNLRVLDLSYNNIVSISPEINQLVNLEKLDLFSNILMSIPPKYVDLSNYNGYI